MKLIFFDIDGTIIDDEKKEMSQSTKEAIEQARKNGHICVINSGRTWKMVKGQVTKFTEFDGYVLGCGTMVTYQGQVLLHESFSKAFSRRIIEALDRYKIDAVLEGAENNFKDSPQRIHYEKARGFMAGFEGMNFGSFEEAPGHFDKFYAYVEDPQSIRAFSEEFSQELSVVDREQGFYEIMPKGISKATGMQFLAQKLGIPMEDTVAVGDSSNDIPMLECAHTSIAMGNGVKAVLEMADYVTTDVTQDGIRNALKWLGVI